VAEQTESGDQSVKHSPHPKPKSSALTSTKMQRQLLLKLLTLSVVTHPSKKTARTPFRLRWSNNAAIQPPSSYVPLDELPAELWDRMLGINLSGYTFLAKHAVRVMKQQHSGVIVNMSSGQAHRTARQVPTYGPIKAANLHQARQWGIEYARDGIRVVSVSPGAIDTPLVRASLEAQGGEKELANRHPLGRIGKPQEVAAAVLWLSSPAASFVTATDLEVDGGLGAFGSFADPYPMPE
jgi:NAD(P)-dependent dehydrogenase (short-subunit alcohol dehydrogenase family)